MLLPNTGVQVKVRSHNISKMDWALEELSIPQSVPDKSFHSCPCYFMWTQLYTMNSSIYMFANVFMGFALVNAMYIPIR